MIRSLTLSRKKRTAFLSALIHRLLRLIVIWL